MSEIHFHGIWRMDWGLGNPNKTGALIAILMVAVWALGWIRKWGFWSALVLFTGLGICLIHTMSRGALIALFAGMLSLVLAAPRPWGRSRIAGAVVAVWVIIGASIYLNAGERYGQGIAREDRSITNRFQIWKAAPRMMNDAPGGWGIGNSGAVYMEWYQPLSSTEGYRTLVNSHLTWMVEIGWPLRVAYLFGWGVIFLLCWPVGASRWLSVPLGIWVTLFVASCFSSVAESPWLWIVPGVSLFAVLGYRIRAKSWPAGRLWVLPLGASLLICGLLAVLGMRQPAMVHKQGGVIIFGKGEPQIWILPDTKVMGTQWGRSVRSSLEMTPSGQTAIALIKDLSAVPSLRGKSVLIAGTAAAPAVLAKVLQEASSVTLVNPSFDPGEVGFSPKGKKVTLIVGEFSESPALSAWKEIVPAKILPGVGDYLPEWNTVLGDSGMP